MLGKNVADVLRRRLADMRAVDFVSELPIGQLTEARGRADNCYEIHLSNGMKLIFSANHSKAPLREDNSVDWASVYRIKILDICDGNE